MRKLVLVLFVLAAMGTAAAHVPRGGAEVRHVHDPSVSQVFYGELENGTHRYTMDVAAGDRVVVGVTVPPGRETAPVVRAVGAGLNATVTEQPGEPVYEPFGPGVHREAGTLDARVETAGTVRVTVQGAGRYGLVVGYEEAYTAAEWAVTPVLLLGTYRWGGAPWWSVVLPLLAVVLAGAWVWHRRDPHPTVHPWLVRGGALLCFGSASVVAVQMAWAVSWTGWDAAVPVTAGIVLLQAAAGAAGVRLEEAGTRRERILLGLAAVAGVAVWAGYLAGPLLYLLAAAIPADLGDRLGLLIGEDHGRKKE